MAQPIDLLLLDLNLRGQAGFDLLANSVAGSFHTIVVSAYTERALDAFAYGVLDFVPKPFGAERLEQALRRATDWQARPRSPVQLLAVRKTGRVELLPVDDVMYVKGAGPYSELRLKSGRSELHDKSLDKLHALLAPSFVRVHKSYLVRASLIRVWHAHEGSHYEVELSNGVRLPVGRTRYKELRETLG